MLLLCVAGSPGSATKQGKMFFQGAGGLVGELPATPRRVTVGQVSRVLCQLYGARLKSTSGSTSGSTSTSSAPAADAPEDNAVPLKQKVLLCTMLLLKKSKNSVVTVSQVNIPAFWEYTHTSVIRSTRHPLDQFHYSFVAFSRNSDTICHIYDLSWSNCMWFGV